MREPTVTDGKPTARTRRHEYPLHKTISVPDAKYIRDHIPVKEVAERLGLEPEPKGKRVRCPLDQGHLARLWLKRNWVLCPKCRKGGKGQHWNPIDLVMEVKRLDAGDAIKWISDHWRIPLCSMILTTNQRGKEKRIYADYKLKPLPDSLKPSEELLARSPGWPKLRASSRMLATVILRKVATGDNPVWEGTQEELRKLAGISRGTMKTAMQELRDIGMIATQRVAAQSPQVRNFTTHMALRLEWNSNRFQKWLQDYQGFWLWVYQDYLRLSKVVQSLDVQNRVTLHENEHPLSSNSSPETQDREACKKYTDKEFVLYLMKMVDERALVKMPERDAEPPA